MLKNSVRRFSLLSGVLLFAAVSGVHAQQYADPPGRVARLSDASGEVSYSPSGEGDWLRASRNRPLISGDRLWTDRRARAELQFGTSSLRADQFTSLRLLNLDDRIAQVEVTQGAVSLSVRRLYSGQEFEIDTPTLAFVVDRPGRYRIDVDPDDGVTTIVAWEGEATAYGEGANFPLYEGEAVTFFDSTLRDYEIYDVPRADSFDRYAQNLDDRMLRSPSLRYVSDDMIGYADLDQYGSWSNTRDYGAVWFPRDVASDWAPYRDGHWAWQEPWGWTWVDDAPWGFAPSHYGRWAYVNRRWGWTPGPRNQRAVYAPALVAFVGGRNWSVSISGSGGSPIGWFPLGPRDVYVPSYRASRDYFNRVNASNTRYDVNSAGSIYNGYASGRSNLGQVRYANRNVMGAVTAVPGNVFTGARPVRESILRLDQNASAKSEVMSMARMAPSSQSIAGRLQPAVSQPKRGVFDRNVIARNAPQPTLQPFAERQQGLQRAPGDAPQMQARPATPANGRPTREQINGVRVLGAQRNVINTREAETSTTPSAEERKPLDRASIESRVERTRNAPQLPTRGVPQPGQRSDRGGRVPVTQQPVQPQVRQLPVVQQPGQSRQQVQTPVTPSPADTATQAPQESTTRADRIQQMRRDADQRRVDRETQEQAAQSQQQARVREAEVQKQVERGQLEQQRNAAQQAQRAQAEREQGEKAEQARNDAQKAANEQAEQQRYATQQAERDRQQEQQQQAAQEQADRAQAEQASQQEVPRPPVRGNTPRPQREPRAGKARSDEDEPEEEEAPQN